MNKQFVIVFCILVVVSLFNSILFITVKMYNWEGIREQVKI